MAKKLPDDTFLYHQASLSATGSHATDLAREVMSLVSPMKIIANFGQPVCHLSI